MFSFFPKLPYIYIYLGKKASHFLLIKKMRIIKLLLSQLRTIGGVGWGPKWGYVLFLSKFSSKMPYVWNYLGICPCFKLDFLKIKFQWKIQFGKNRIIGNQTYKKTKEKKAWNLSSMLVFSRNSIFSKSSFSLKLDFLKSSFKTGTYS